MWRGWQGGVKEPRQRALPPQTRPRRFHPKKKSLAVCHVSKDPPQSP